MRVSILLCLLMALNLDSMAQSILPYEQGFEDEVFLPTDWQAFGSNANAAWQHNNLIGAYGKSSGSAFFDNFSGNLSGNYYGMRAVSLDLTNAVKPMMKFDVAYARRNASTSDILGIWYSFNGTTGWQNLQNFQGNLLATASDQNSYFTPTATDWDSITIDLSQFAGKALVRLAFENNCQNGNVLYIDNVRFYDSQFVGIKGVSTAKTAVTISPNPISNGMFHINSKNQILTQYKLFDQTGVEVANEPLSQKSSYQVVLDNLKPGMYFLQVFYKDSSSGVQKIILN